MITVFRLLYRIAIRQKCSQLRDKLWAVLPAAVEKYLFTPVYGILSWSCV